VFGGRYTSRALLAPASAARAAGIFPAMTTGTQHVLIVGGGVIGLCAAEALSRRGARVTVVEASSIGAGASSGNAGLLSLGHLPIPQPGVVGKAMKWMWRGDSPLYIQPRLDAALVGWLWRFRGACNAQTLEASMRTLGALSTMTVGMFEELRDRCASAGVPGFYFDRLGYYEVYRTEAGLAHGREHAAIAARHGFGHEVFDGAQMREREPALAEGTVGAVWYPDSSQCNPMAFLRAVAALAAAQGATILEGAPVASVDVEGGRAVGVTLGDGRELRADVVVMAAGPWSAELLQPLGVKVPMQPAKGYHLDVPTTDPALRAAIVLGEANMAVTPMDGFVRLAGTLEFSGLNTAMRRNRLEMLLVGARKYLRGYDGSVERRSEWVGMRPCSPDGLPILGWTDRAPGLLVATGHGMLGMTQGPATGRLVAEMVLDGAASSMDVGPMGLARF
jgi:D-amino-acid dehydrogenase